ncbi:facilitated trehalose transporter Tret1-2 homolog isoform X2 [Anoplophora glabripennis]|uniref:facilitated trehalose transporter Tret1-2 homolog isoform X2 n=1 Tax=Anoplophora glabripennis TaxID=217634 RepID=UPI000873A2C5|nr:facilitated trehalose transporter Tret1-2 homolog isoform X2 [Anoplophora glabripennis]
MEPIGASCISLYCPENNIRLNENDENIKELVQSCKSLSEYESKSIKSLVPQIIASLIAASFHIGNGISLAYSAILISQLGKPESDIKSTESQNSWMASVLIVVIPFSSVFSGMMMDGLGRLNTIKIAGIPGVIGWSLIAISPNVPWIIMGRLLVGISAAWGTSPGIVYITEIASVNLRMSLMAIAPAYVSLGMVLTYLGGWILHWRTLAWISNIFIVVPCITCIFIHESPSWLIWKGKLDAAKKALDWMHKYQPNPKNAKETYADLQFNLLQEEQQKKREENTNNNHKGAKAILLEFMKPTGYKPIIILNGLFFFQHFSGIYITMFYSISFIEQAGSSVNPFLASILIGVVRLIMSILSIYILKTFCRRSLMFVSTFGMAICMFVAGLFTKLIQENATTMKWVPVAALLYYVITSTIGLLPIPTMLIAELFPLEIRGIGYSVSYSLNCMFMFAALQSYFDLNAFFGGATNLQWFFACICLGGLVYSYIFVPETFGMTLKDITEYFKTNWLYIGYKKAVKSKSQRQQGNLKGAKASVVTFESNGVKVESANVTNNNKMVV